MRAVAALAAAEGVTLVIPTVGRPSLGAVLSALAADPPPSVPFEVIVVDDRRTPGPPLTVPPALSAYARVVCGSGRGPAAARNVGWRAARHPWVAFLDDDVVPDHGWVAALLTDLDVPDRVGGVQGRVQVPLPAGRRPTDWERGTAGLAGGKWITADMAYRRAALAAVGGFDERFPRAFREDAELAHRVRRAGWQLVRGERAVTHPVRPENRWVSLRTQRGNADDALLRRMYGRDWRRTVDVPPGRRPRHVAVTAAGLAALGCAVAALTGPARTRRAWKVTGSAAGAAWLAGTAEFAVARVAPGPRTPAEVTTMVLTSAAIPPLAVAHWLRGWWQTRGAAAQSVAQQAVTRQPVTQRPVPSGR
ncbi:MAG TPA: glycosyltransferase [Pilimelia sp.]|nr:glycosyltransferase [Pilimelia sp.]